MKNVTQSWKRALGVSAACAVIALTPRGLAEDASVKVKPYPLNTCLVSGEKLDGEMGKPYVLTYQGQEFKLCCPACKKDFDQDPAKYAKMLAKAEWQANGVAVKSGHGATHHGPLTQKGAERLMLLPRADRHADVKTAQSGEGPGLCCPKCRNMMATVTAPASRSTHPEETK